MTTPHTPTPAERAEELAFEMSVYADNDMHIPLPLFREWEDAVEAADAAALAAHEAARAAALVPCAFVTRHEPTAEQVEMLATIGLRPVWVGDVDAFDADAIREKVIGYEYFVAVHPMVFATACGGNGYRDISDPDAIRTGLAFRNEARAGEGAAPYTPRFSEIWAMRPCPMDDGLGGMRTWRML